MITVSSVIQSRNALECTLELFNMTDESFTQSVKASEPITESQSKCTFKII